MKRRAVITGVGLITPLGIGVPENLKSLTAGKCGIAPITRFDATRFPARIAGEVKNFDPTRWMPSREVKTVGRFLQFAIAAGASAMSDSGLPSRFDEERAERAACIVGVGFGGLDVIEAALCGLQQKGPKFGLTPYTISASIINLAPGQLAIRHNVKGPSFSIVSACATGAHSIGEAARGIQWGLYDYALAGGAEAAIEPLSIAGFGSARALSTRNCDPEAASRPFDRDRDGFVVAEGAGIVLLEEMELAKRRGARIYGEVKGYGCSSDAHHVTEPAPAGAGAQRCMRFALQDAQVDKEQIGYINAHGTSTRFNDATETHAIKAVFGEYAGKLAVSSTKSMMGHALGAAGAIEAVISVLTLVHNCLFPTINYANPDPDCDLDYVPNQARQKRVDYVMSNSFGFGGTNACLILGRV
jgi:3-oxoacyl-[acyl-carrier-protein] synthase II